MIKSVSSRHIRIADKTYEHSIALTADGICEDWGTRPVAELGEADFGPLLAADPDIIVLGTGTTHVFAPRDLVFALARRGIGFEVMDTPAAARTYNVLAAEDRQVAAIFYLDSVSQPDL
jgi:uncharacterized protein